MKHPPCAGSEQLPCTLYSPWHPTSLQKGQVSQLTKVSPGQSKGKMAAEN